MVVTAIIDGYLTWDLLLAIFVMLGMPKRERERSQKLSSKSNGFFHQP